MILPTDYQRMAVSPCLPHSDVKTFGELRLRHHKRVVVGAYPDNFGTHAVGAPGKPAHRGWANWLLKNSALSLYEWLHERIDDQQAGFLSLAAR